MISQPAFSIGRLLPFLTRLFAARDGAVAIYVAFVSVLMMGFGALVVDAGRVYTLQTEMQDAADAAALAGAAELDLTATSITRATAAAKTTFVNNVQTFATGGKDIVINDANIRFLSSLPPDDDTPIPVSSVTTDPTKAKFIQVTPPVREVDYLLAPVLNAFFGGPGSNLRKGQASATAVAGLECVVCDFPPLMICNPGEANGNTGAPFTPVPGELVKLKLGGGTGLWTPGNFGLLDPPGTSQGTAAITEALANSNPNGCYATYVDTRTGAATNPVSKAFNTRFDMYENPGFGGNSKNNSAYKPAPNVIKGKYMSGSSWEDYSGSPPAGRAMPKHPCYSAGNCSSLGPLYHERFAPPAPGNLSDQQSFWSDYWSSNHPGESFASAYAGGLDADNDGVVTRQEMYEYEIATGIPAGDTDGDGDVDADDAALASSATGENGRPMNYGGADAPDPKRRTMYVAVINCVAEGPLNGNSEHVPVLAYAKMFLTHPAEDGSDQEIYAEIIGVLEPSTDGSILHDIVQLYR